jgi:excisionase family DNA binding protein
VEELLSTREMGWILGKSPGAIRRMIREGEIESVRVPGAIRIPKAEAIRAARQRIEAEAGRKVSDRELERLIDQVITTNEQGA